MRIGLIFALSVAVIQPDAFFSEGMPPVNVPTFEVIFDDSPPFFAAIKIEGEWVSDHRLDIRPSQTIELVADTPFYRAAPFFVTKRRVQLNYEAPAMRRHRLENIWRTHGYTFVETSSGWKPVKETDAFLADRARAMAEAARETDVTDFSIHLPASMQETQAPISTGTLHILRAGIILIGLILCVTALAIIYRPRDQ